MSTWNAINVESDDEDNIEIDDTKEILLEEAFKLYQNALRLHSQGPAYYDEAREAYEELFSSDIFKYPEAVSDFDHDQHDETPVTTALPVEMTGLSLTLAGVSDNANSLPHLMYLAYKSRAQFEIDSTHHYLVEASLSERSEIIKSYARCCKQSLTDSAIALERDDTDLDLWKRSAKVSDVLQTVRIVRFCWESVLAGDDVDETSIDLSGLDEAYAKGEIQSVVDLLEDTLAARRADNQQPRQKLLSILQQSNDPYPFLPKRSKQIKYMDDRKRPLMFTIGETRIQFSTVNHYALAQALLQLTRSHKAGSSDLGIGGYVKLDLPSMDQNSDMLIDSEGVEAHEMVDATPEIETPASFHSILDPEQPQSASNDEQKSIRSSSEQAAKPATEGEAAEEHTLLTEPRALPSRKRSSTAAGMEEPEARSKSKRIKARESLAGTVAQEEEVALDPSSLHREQYYDIEAADDTTLKTMNSILEKIGVDGFRSVEKLRASHFEQADDNERNQVASDSYENPPLSDLRHAFKAWNEEKSAAFINGHNLRDHVDKTNGLVLFLKHSKTVASKDSVALMIDDETRIRHLCQTISEQATNIEEALFFWLLEILTAPSANGKSPYLEGVWASDLKQVVLQLLIAEHESIAANFRAHFALQVDQWDKQIGSGRLLSIYRSAELVQTIFELHLDMLAEITNPTSTVDEETRNRQQLIVQTWAEITTDAIQFIKPDSKQMAGVAEELVLRFLWASVAHAKVSGSTDKRHILLCLEDLKAVIQHIEIEELHLPNISNMSIISVSAVDQEISKAKTLEFFMSVFDSDSSEPLSVILRLEPILESDIDESAAMSQSELEQIDNFRSFLKAGDASLTLFLWKRLLNAYTAITYNTKVVSCLLRSIETIVTEIELMHEKESDVVKRETELLRWLRDADELLTKALAKIADDKEAFECINEGHLKSSISAIVILIQIVYEFALTDDCLRMGFTPPPTHRNATAAKNFEKCRDRFRELYVKLWTMLYLLIKESTVLLPGSFTEATQDLILYLRCVHASLGQRQYCKYCNKLFIRMAKAELFSFDTEEDLSIDIAQIIFDLYQIKLGGGSMEIDHGCSAETLEKDKKTAHMLVPIVMDFVQRMNVKDLLRSDIKATIERIQAALGQPKSSVALSFNRRAISTYLKSLVSPKQLYQCLRGIGELETKIVHGESADIAATGWYLLLGNVTLAKYKSIKRINPTPTDDLDVAQGHLRLDLEFDSSNWEAWYRLAQVYDSKIEDNLIWNANKLNDARGELATLERNTLNAYSMAAAIAMRSAADTLNTTKLMKDMFFEFGLRLYASSRPPLDMDAFSTDKAVRHLSNYVDGTMSKQALIKPMTEFHLWSFAAHLIRKSLSGEQQPWNRYYYLGKCLWKMFNHERNKDSTKRPVEVEDVLDAFTEAVNRVPKKERAADPILEPHFKLVSTVHKLHTRGTISAETAVGFLEPTSYAKGVSLHIDAGGKPEWDDYVLQILKKLQNADKSGWHHRITARAAHVLFDKSGDVAGALGAKLQYVDSIFTKAMMMQVWKPENERAGRHYVYTGRYLRFFVGVLDKLRDRSNLEQVIRKIRRKTTDFIDHSKVWDEAVTVYVDLLRSLGNIPRGRERELFDRISFDEFSRMSDKLETWAHDPQTTTTYLDTIKDAVEIKKLNNSLMKGTAIDDLIGDTYACMYELFISQLPEEEKTATQATAPQGTFINLTADHAPTGDDTLDRMRLNNLISGQMDGATPSVEESASVVPGLGLKTDHPQSTETPPPEVVRAPAPAKPGRAKTITRREVQRKAEGAIGKPPPIKTPTLTKRSISVNIPSIKKDFALDEADDEEREQTNTYRTGIISGVSSRRGTPGQTPNPDNAEAEDEGGDGDNEEEEEDDNENGGSDSDDQDQDQSTLSKKRLFSGADGAQDDDEPEEIDDEEDDNESGDDKMIDVKDAHVNDAESRGNRATATPEPVLKERMDVD